MSRSVNKVILVGNVGRDPDMRTAANGSKMVTLSLATSYKAKGGTEKTEWHRLTCWDKVAEIAEEYVRKGDRIYIEGSMQYGSFEKSGVTILTADVQVRDLVLLGGNDKGGTSPFDSDD